MLGNNPQDSQVLPLLFWNWFSDCQILINSTKKDARSVKKANGGFSVANARCVCVGNAPLDAIFVELSTAISTKLPSTKFQDYVWRATELCVLRVSRPALLVELRAVPSVRDQLTVASFALMDVLGGFGKRVEMWRGLFLPSAPRIFLCKDVLDFGYFSINTQKKLVCF